MKKLLSFVVICLAFVYGGAASAQSTTGAVSGSNSASSSKVNATQGNQQAAAAVVTIDQSQGAIPTRTSVRETTAPPVQLAGFGTSFSSDSCVSTAGVGASIMGGGITAAKGVRDTACSKIRQFYAWGAEAKYDHDVRDTAGEAIATSMRRFTLCMADGDAVEACKKLGAIK